MIWRLRLGIWGNRNRTYNIKRWTKWDELDESTLLTTTDYGSYTGWPAKSQEWPKTICFNMFELFFSGPNHPLCSMVHKLILFTVRITFLTKRTLFFCSVLQKRPGGTILLKPLAATFWPFSVYFIFPYAICIHWSICKFKLEAFRAFWAENKNRSIDFLEAQWGRVWWVFFGSRDLLIFQFLDQLMMSIDVYGYRSPYIKDIIQPMSYNLAIYGIHPMACHFNIFNGKLHGCSMSFHKPMGQDRHT